MAPRRLLSRILKGVGRREAGRHLRDRKSFQPTRAASAKALGLECAWCVQRASAEADRQGASGDARSAYSPHLKGLQGSFLPFQSAPGASSPLRMCGQVEARAGPGHPVGLASGFLPDLVSCPGLTLFGPSVFRAAHPFFPKCSSAARGEWLQGGPGL